MRLGYSPETPGETVTPTWTRRRACCHYAPMASVLVADDHPIFRHGLVQLVTSLDGLEVIAEASNGKEALELVTRHEPDVAILDQSMPEMSGLEAAREIGAAGLDTRALILTAIKDPALAASAMKEEAVGAFVLKTESFKELAFAIEAVLSGGRFISPAIAGSMLELGGGADAHLTARERDVLRHIAGGLSNKQIAAELGVSIKTVDTHRTSVMRKLGVQNAAALVAKAIRLGLVEA